MAKTNSKILTEAINIAIKNGWQAPGKLHKVSNWGGSFSNPVDNNILYVWFEAEDQQLPIVSLHARYNWKQIVFNKEFAKALWPGDSKVMVVTEPGENKSYFLPAWQYHLQMMVVSEDPIVYLGANL